MIIIKYLAWACALGFAAMAGTLVIAAAGKLSIELEREILGMLYRWL